MHVDVNNLQGEIETPESVEISRNQKLLKTLIQMELLMTSLISFQMFPVNLVLKLKISY